MCFYKDPSMVLKMATVHNTFWRSTVDNKKKKGDITNRLF